MDRQRDRRLARLATVLSDRHRVKIGEEIGSASSPSAGSTTSDTFARLWPPSHHLNRRSRDGRHTLQLILACGEDFAANGVTEDALTRARQPALTARRQALRTHAC